MGAVEMDRQAIERRDFPIVRRGYDPASVDAHLRALAGQVEELSKQAGGPGRDSLAATAGAQVQSILEAAQASAQAIEAEAAAHAASARAEADADARRTREQAVAAAQERVAAVTAATEALLQRVGTMDGETKTLVESLHGGAGRLVGDMEALSVEMGTLYDAAAGRTSESVPAVGGPEAAVPADGASAATASVPAPAAPVQPEPAVAIAAPAPAPSSAQAPTPAPDSPPPNGDDLDGARLVALNMALNGDSREATDRFLAENYDLPDRERLLDEVFAAIEV
jgi:DivIVA domain-containing protein